jgi:hypothetical protein
MVTRGSIRGSGQVGANLTWLKNLEIATAGENTPGDPRELVGCGATTSFIRRRRLTAASIQGLRPKRSQHAGCISTALAPCINPQDNDCRVSISFRGSGDRRSNFAWVLDRAERRKSRPLANGSPVPTAAIIAVEMIGPTPGTVIGHLQSALRLAVGGCQDRGRGSVDDRALRNSVARL